MTKTKVIVLVSFLAAFAAGTAVGLLVGRSAQTPRQRSWLSRELGLTPEQRDQMREIWSEFMRAAGGHRRALQEERDQAVQALFTEEQKAQYEELMQEYSRKLEELAQQRRELYQQAVERTKQILSEPQRKKYEELLERRGEGFRRHYRGNRERGRTEVSDTPRAEE